MRFRNSKTHCCMTYSRRLTYGIINGFVGWFCGHMGAALVWSWLYGIGSRVISDDTYATLEPQILQAGEILGATSGFICGCALPLWGIVVVLGLNLAATLIGCIAGNLGWKVAVAAFAIAHTVSIGITIGYSIPRAGARGNEQLAG